MVVRKPYIAGNWKMNLERKSALGLVSAVRERFGQRQDIDGAVFPPFVYLDEIARTLHVLGYDWARRTAATSRPVRSRARSVRRCCSTSAQRS